MFAWHIAWKHLTQGKKKNILVSIQIVIAIVLLTTVFSVKYSMEKKLNTLIEDNRADVLYLQGRNENGRHYRDYSEKHYADLKEMLGDRIEMALVARSDISMMTSQETIKPYTAYEYMGDFFLLAFQKKEKEPVEDSVIATKEFFEFLAENKKHQAGFLAFRKIIFKEVDKEKECLVLRNGQKLTRVFGEMSSNEIYFSSGIYLEGLEEKMDALEECVILPYGTGMLANSEKETSIGFRLKNQTANYEDISKILSYFNESTNGEYRFGITSIRGEYERKNREFSTVINIVNFIIAFSLAVVILGFIGNLLLSLERRKKYMATACVCGANKIDIFLTIFYEQAFIIGSGLVLGNLIGIPLQWMVAKHVFFTYYIDFYSIALMNIVAVMVVLLLELIPILYLRRFDFIEILKKEE